MPASYSFVCCFKFTFVTMTTFYITIITWWKTFSVSFQETKVHVFPLIFLEGLITNHTNVAN